VPDGRTLTATRASSPCTTFFGKSVKPTPVLCADADPAKTATAAIAVKRAAMANTTIPPRSSGVPRRLGSLTL
jgi:hypothetical protein